MKYHFSITTFFVGLTVIVALVMSLYQSPIKPHRAQPLPYRSPVLSLELAQSPGDVQAILIDESTNPDLPFIQKMINFNWLDFLFIIAYTGFLVAFSREYTVPSVRYLSVFTVGVALAAGLFDVLEDVQLFRIFELVQHPQKAEYGPILSRLSFFTWCKWLSLAIVPVLLSPHLWTNNFFLKSVAGLSAMTALCGVVALLLQLPCITNLFVFLVFLTIPGLMIYSIYRTLSKTVKPLSI